MSRAAVVCVMGVAVGMAMLQGMQPAVAASTEVAVKARPNPIREIDAVVSASWFAWSQTSVAHPNTYNVYVQAIVAGRPSGPVTRVNPPGTEGFAGGISGTTLAYQQIRGGGSDIKLYDLVSRVVSSPPPGVNSPDWEYRPTISGDWLLFGRNRDGYARELLYNLATHSVRVLKVFPILPRGASHREFNTGQVNGDFAAFAAGAAFRYTISTRTLEQVDMDFFSSNSGIVSAAVSSTGTMYVVDEDAQGDSIYAVPNPATRKVLVLGGNLLGGSQLFRRLQVATSNSGDQVYFTQTATGTLSHDIYRVVGNYPTVTNLQADTSVPGQVTLTWINPIGFNLAAIVVSRYESTVCPIDPTDPARGVAIGSSAVRSSQVDTTGTSGHSECYTVFAEDAAGDFSPLSPAVLAVFP